MTRAARIDLQKDLVQSCTRWHHICVDDDFSDLFETLDAPTESARPARASKLDRVEIEDSEGLRAIVEAELETERFETDDFGTIFEGEIVISYDAASGRDIIDAAHEAYRIQASSLRSYDDDWQAKYDALCIESDRLDRLEDLSTQLGMMGA